MPKNDAERESQLAELASKLFFTREKQGLRFGLYRDVDVSKPVRHDGLSLDEVETYLILGSFAVRTVGERTGRKRTNHRLASSVVNLKERNKDGHAHKKQADQINQFMHEQSLQGSCPAGDKKLRQGEKVPSISSSVSPSELFQPSDMISGRRHECSCERGQPLQCFIASPSPDRFPARRNLPARCSRRPHAERSRALFTEAAKVLTPRAA
jgi:hypothetical protein